MTFFRFRARYLLSHVLLLSLPTLGAGARARALARLERREDARGGVVTGAGPWRTRGHLQGFCRLHRLRKPVARAHGSDDFDGEEAVLVNEEVG